ncbi:unnamed protein product [Echinostoma caproni]|uniref:Transposase n=1 Tax=Echinostoma caproni TaxID=27848 RepID=A0A183A3J7_9TREM|nr:unnamed protein product [Echinostoma caproni]
MNIQEFSRSPDGFVFRCTHCKKRMSIRSGTFFEKSRLPLTTLMELMFYFVMEEPVTRAAAMANVSRKSSIQWYTYCRDVCSSVMCSLPTQLGGVGSTVEVDESVAVKNEDTFSMRQDEATVTAAETP